MLNKFSSTFKYKLIYIFRINDERHLGYLKIGETTINTDKSYDELFDNCSELNYYAKERIDSYTSTAGVAYELLHTEVAVYKNNDRNSKYYGKVKAFKDHNVHEVLTRSGIKKKYFDTNKKQNEWFKTDLQTAIKAIKAVKDNKRALDNKEITNNLNPIIFRPEQLEAIKKTKNKFKTGNSMLWNAKMRFGKTLTALQIAKELEFNKTIIITHRPVVSEGWYEDFYKIFYDKPNYSYASKTIGKTIKELLNEKCNFIYFASIQDLRGSDIVGGNYEKNKELFEINWDFVVIDEAHEGTQTNLGKDVLEKIIKPNSDYITKVLELSGTPFNLMTNYEPDSIYTWDYIMEQDAKAKWGLEHFGDTNPYEELPKMNIFTYHLPKYLAQYLDVEDKAFNFREFFRTWTGDIEKDFEILPNNVKIGDFVHENDIVSFLDLICKESNESNYPFSTEEYRNYFRHSLWMVPGVKEAKALRKILKKHKVFKFFEIINVAGDGDEEKNSTDALSAVKKAITDSPEETYTITLSCGRLTTGVSVPEWTAVIMLYGTYSTAASQYLQTIFRVQTPANINGKIKDNCYVFDFAPDRTLKIVAESVQLSASANNKEPVAEKLLGKFLNYCPVISVSNSSMKVYKVNELLQELKKAYAERVVKNGFDDSKLYNNDLLRLDEIEIKEFEYLKKIIGESKQSKNINNININDEGFTNEQLEDLKRIENKKRTERTEEEKEKLLEYKKAKETREKAISILRGISIRIPLLVYGIDKDIDIDITVDNFADKNLIDDLSWEEFMPKGIDREIFKKFSKYYDKDVFVSASRRIRAISKTSDDLEPTERTIRIANLFSTFKNPDKETVLTPWKVVNMHMSETIGGYNFYDDTYENMLDNPTFINNGEITEDTILNNNSNILEINSKTGLYPLYIAYSIYKAKCSKTDDILTFEKKQEIWDETIKNNIYVICKTPMAKSITQRTLVGYRNVKTNTKYFENLIENIKEEKTEEKFISKVKQGKDFWNREEKTNNMKFNAIVGNPPYQGTNHQQIYPFFYLTSIKMADHVSLIFPIGWQEPKNGNNLSKMNTENIKSDKQIVFLDNRQNVFPGVSGAEWVNIILWEKDYDNKLKGKQLIYTNGKNPKKEQLLWNEKDISKPKEIIELANIVMNTEGFKSIQEITSKRKPYGLSTDVFENYSPNTINDMSNKKIDESDIKVYGKNNMVRYLSKDYKFTKIGKGLNKYKIFVAYAWGNMSENTGLGGAFSDIIIANPNEIATETYLESGAFNDYDVAKKHAKYLMTKFLRALLYFNKKSQHSTTAWGAIPLQDYNESWWDKSIKEIDKELIKKYNIPENIAEFINKNIQERNENNIINFNNKKQ